MANAVFDITKNLIFSKRRINKGANGDFGSFAVAAGQIRNGVGAVAEIDNAVGKGAKYITNVFDATAKSSSALGYVAKGVNIVSKAVNPTIAAVSGIRVLCADDKTSMAINQAYALAGMFTFENASKLFLHPEGRAKLLKYGFGDKGLVKHLMKAMAYVDKIASNPGSSKWLRIGIPVAKGLGFVGMSILGYSLGSKIGNNINYALKNKTSVFEAKKSQSQAVTPSYV